MNLSEFWELISNTSIQSNSTNPCNVLSPYSVQGSVVNSTRDSKTNEFLAPGYNLAEKGRHTKGKKENKALQSVVVMEVRNKPSENTESGFCTAGVGFRCFRD